MIGFFKNKIQSILSDPFWRNVAVLFSGTAVAQALPLLVFPLLTRIYSKEALGFYFIFAAIGIITQIIASLQYQLAIVIPKSKTEALHVFHLSLVITFLISLLSFIIIDVFYDSLTGLLEQKEFAQWLYAIPVSLFFLGIFRVASYYLNREEDYKLISIGKVVKAVSFSGLQLLFGLLGFLKAGLILSLLVGQALSGMYLLIAVFRKYKLPLRIKWNKLWEVAVKYKDMPIYNTTVAVISAVSTQLPLFFLSRYFGVGFTGDYGLSNRVVSTPMELIGTSIGQVFTQESANVVNQKGNLYQLVKTTYLRLFKLAVIPFFLLFISSYWLFPLLFGAQYQSSGILTMILIPWLFLHFLNSSLSFLFNVLRKQRFMTIFHTLFLAVRIAVLFIGYSYFNDAFVAVGLFSFVGIVFNIYLMWYYLRISKRPLETNYFAK